MTSSAQRSAPHPASSPPPPSPPHVGGGGVQRPLLYSHRHSSFGARSGASPLTRSRGFTPRDRLDDFKRAAERATSRIKLPPPLSPPHVGGGGVSVRNGLVQMITMVIALWPLPVRLRSSWRFRCHSPWCWSTRRSRPR